MTPVAPPTDSPGEGSTTERASDDGASVRPLAADAGDRVADAVDALRATADQVNQRIPVVIDTVRGGALESARTIETMPESNQRLLAAFSLGLGIGLSISGAPRVIVAAALAPALFIAALVVGRDPTAAGRT